MNTRQRFPGNGYRPNAISSRISPETSIRSHPNFYNSDNRNFNRSFGRMHPKSPLPMQHQVPRKGNLFIEAGRLAVDYLISHGLLPPDVLSNPSSNGSFKINDDLEFNPKHQEVAEDLISPREGHSTAPISSDTSLSAADASETGRRSPVYVKEKRRLLRPFSSTDLIAENGRNGSLPEKASTSADVIANCNSVPSQQNAKEVDPNIANSIDDGAHIKQYQDEKSFSSQKSNSSVDDITQSIDQLSSVHVELEKESSRSDLGDGDAVKNSSIRYCEEEVGISRKDHDLLKLCSSELPTKSFTSVRPADKNLLMLADGSNNSCQSSSAAQFTVPVKNTSNSDPSGSSAYELCGPMDKVRGEKRSLETLEAKDNPKKVKDWLTDLRNDESSQLSVSENKHLGIQELMPLPGRVGIPAVNKDSVAIGSMQSKDRIGPSVAYSEEKQLFPGSFKICDLNLIMEVSDAQETHNDSTIVYSSNPVPKKAVSVDIDLSMSNCCNLNSMYSKHENPGKGVEIIDLESDPLHGDKGFHTSARRMQSEFTGLESFPNHLQNPSENPDVQDGYGLMLSELMGNDIQNCSSAQPEMISLHNDISLHHGGGILSDDDQIYMSLGEIPLSLMGSWDPPTQDYEKPF